VQRLDLGVAARILEILRGIDQSSRRNLLVGLVDHAAGNDRAESILENVLRAVISIEASSFLFPFVRNHQVRLISKEHRGSSQVQPPIVPTNKGRGSKGMWETSLGPLTNAYSFNDARSRTEKLVNCEHF